MIYPRTTVAERRRKITKLLVRGFTPSEISEGIGASKDTVYNDIRYIRSGRNEDLAEYGRRQMLAQVMINARERVRELWKVVEKSESPYVKLLALRELRIHDQQVLSHLFLFTQASSGHCEPDLSGVAISSNNDKKKAADPSKLVKKRHKSLKDKELNLQAKSQSQVLTDESAGTTTCGDLSAGRHGIFNRNSDNSSLKLDIGR